MFVRCRISRVVGRNLKKVLPLLRVLRRLFVYRMLGTSWLCRRRSVDRLLVWWWRLRFVVVTFWLIWWIGSRRLGLLGPSRCGARLVFLVVWFFVVLRSRVKWFVVLWRRKALRILLMRVLLLVAWLCRIRMLLLLIFFVVICRVVVWRGRARVWRPRRFGFSRVRCLLIGLDRGRFVLVLRVLKW